MTTSRKKQDRDITRIVGILFLEILAAMALLSFAGFAHQQRTGQADPHDSMTGSPTRLSKSIVFSPTYLSGKSARSTVEKSLPRIEFGRYNSRW